MNIVHHRSRCLAGLVAAAALASVGAGVRGEEPREVRTQRLLLRDGRVAAIVPAAAGANPGFGGSWAVADAPVLSGASGGGRTRTAWQRMTVPPGLYLRAISMGSPMVGFAAGELGIVLRTVDGGNTWQTILNQGFPYYYYGCQAIDEQNVVISGFQNQSGEGIIRWSGDGGNTWGPVIALPSPSPIHWLIGVHFAGPPPGFGVIQGFSGQVFSTVTGGRTAGDWSVATPSQNWYQGSFTVLADGRAWIGGYDNVGTTDFGQHWSMIADADPLFDGAINVRPSGFGLIGGGTISPTVSGWVYRTSNGGASWGPGRVLNTTYPVRAVMTLSDRRGWAAGGNVYSNVGGIWGTTDGGATWALEQDVGNEILDLTQVRVDAFRTDVYAAGYISEIWRTRVVVCAVDFNSDGMVNVADFLAYLSAFAAGSPAADFDGDGVVNIGDFLAYLAGYAAGCG
jgi:hypothetical protein